MQLCEEVWLVLCAVAIWLRWCFDISVHKNSIEPAFPRSIPMRVTTLVHPANVKNVNIAPTHDMWTYRGHCQWSALHHLLLSLLW